MHVTNTNAAAERISGPTTTLAELLDVKAVAELLGCSPRTVYRLADADRMPRPVKLGALVRWRRGEILDWIDGGCRDLRGSSGKAGRR